MVEILEAKKVMTAEEYLARERASLREEGGKHEFFKGSLLLNSAPFELKIDEIYRKVDF